MEIAASAVKELREVSGAGIMECRKALEEAGGNIDKALSLLREGGMAKAEKRAGRETGQGMVEAYLHAGGRIGAMVEVNCESDFVGRTDEFRTLAHDLAMQVAATSPKYLDKDSVPAGEEADPAEVCLLEQPFIKEPSKSVRDLISEAVSKTGENIRVRRFARFELGGE